MRPKFSDILHDFLGLIYPRYCLACKDGLVKGEDVFCTCCILELPRADYHLDKTNPLYWRLFGRLRVEHAFAFLHFRKGGKVQHLLHELKYYNHPEVARTIGRVYGEELAKSGYLGRFDCILPIPLHPAKLRRRGYNQSEEFAKGLSTYLKTGCHSNALRRISHTETQTRKTKLKRWQNVKDVFEVSQENAVKGRRILLVDDVITTGATLEACGQVILEAGCEELSVAGMAYAHE